MERPNTTWKDKSIKAEGNAEEPIWVSCKVCGTENQAFASSVDAKEYVCNACRKKDEIPVSMRCLRHKKRFNVPKWWTDISTWLCPVCFDRLSEEDRTKYAPKGIVPPTKAAEEGKPTIVPSKGKEEYAIAETEVKVESCESASISEEEKKTAVVEDIGESKTVQKEKPKSRKWRRVESRISDNTSFAGLLPRYKIECQKCGEIVPCHYIWFEKSTVLCPSCYGKMNEYEIYKFHLQHKAIKPRHNKDDRPLVSLDKSVLKPVEVSEQNWTRKSHLVNSGGYWSNARIMNASEKELKEAARMGIVSKVRMRIELNRRAQAEYYDMLSEEVGVTPIPIY